MAPYTSTENVAVKLQKLNVMYVTLYMLDSDAVRDNNCKVHGVTDSLTLIKQTTRETLNFCDVRM